jgi:hypothetical protein
LACLAALSYHYISITLEVEVRAHWIHTGSQSVAHLSLPQLTRVTDAARPVLEGLETKGKAVVADWQLAALKDSNCSRSQLLPLLVELHLVKLVLGSTHQMRS